MICSGLLFGVEIFAVGSDVGHCEEDLRVMFVCSGLFQGREIGMMLQSYGVYVAKRCDNANTLLKFLK